MTEGIFLILLVVFLALIFDFINGFHDTANAVATSIATGALSPRTAIILASFLNLLGALAFTGVAHTIGEGIANPTHLNNGLYVVLAAVLSAIGWNLLTWYLGLPSSSSHALIGSLAGALAGAAGWDAVNLLGLLIIIKVLIISPLLAVALGFLMMSAIRLLLSFLSSAKTEFYFKKMQVVTASFQAFSHGTNDAQKTMGVITFALVAGGLQQDFCIPLWVKLSAAIAMAAGTAVGGWRIIQTVSRGITPLYPSGGFSADLSSAGIIIGATILHLPLSTTHVISSSIIGVGLSKGLTNINWQTVSAIISAWVITLPVSIILGAVICRVIMLL
ncbi:inorganic phosphate transporter [Desulfofalx alkaliphila]|uniref:inorganic phosphate transporter n=1 Tax=Desulfofalx alkaliphila TaxID=105483 RepID=UPI0004E175C9|nr:inorganic phosphate transporter [Desulfofalx alkaliphila]